MIEASVRRCCGRPTFWRPSAPGGLGALKAASPPSPQLLWIAAVVVFCGAQAAWAAEGRIPELSDQEAWRHLPAAIAGQGERLPRWARILAPSLPRTTAAMLEMEAAYRTHAAPDPKLWAKIRWVAARTHACEYAAAYARADLIAHGEGDAQLQAIDRRPATVQTREERTLEFARRMCREAYEVSDYEVKELLADHGPENLTAIVLLLAYANFQDRLLNTLGVAVEPDGPLPPPAARFDWPVLTKQPPRPMSRMVPESVAGDEPVPLHVDDAAWALKSHAALRLQLELQQSLAVSRIPLPAAEVVERNTPAGLSPPGRASAIRWNCVTFGYQPKLAAAWIFTLRRFREEAALPDDFRQSVFWVVTRSNLCFY